MHTRLPRTLLPGVALVAAGLLVLGGCGDDPSPASGDTSPTRGTDRPDRPGKGDDRPSVAPTSEGGGAATTVPVYFVGDTERAGPRLYREFQRVDGDPLVAAAGLLTAGDSLDPDYRTLFPGGAFAAVSYDAGRLVATLADDGWTTRAPGMSRSEARVAVQSLVYTLQGVQQERAPLVVEDAGGSPTTLFGVDTSGGVAAAPPLDVLSHVSLTSPEEGASVDGGTLEVSGVGNSFEANLGWEVRRGDEVVLDGYATLEGWMEEKLFPFEASVDVSGLEPGDYTFWVTTDDPAGGTEGVGAMTDDRSFTVG
ncbi:hypothetical protein GCM10009623_33820 [Nocardioides aestuarii]|uniref:Gmad2 immunoglobulin-like domain-containing protein n=1 Tax=Nocardioides aestuarii TaxID=252231 RepID=A0ABW4TPH9_9ACTN